MKKPLLVASLAAALMVPVAVSHACAEHEAQKAAAQEPAAGEEAAATPVEDLYAPSRASMHEHMNVAPSGNPDVDFAANMIPHHEGAVEMAKVQLQYGKDPELRRLAEQIISSQEKEIVLMKAWLVQKVKSDGKK